ncbi:MAG: sugar transferase [Solirubrobacteraceae bacterium]
MESAPPERIPVDLGLNRSSLKIKRAFDVVFAGIAIVLLAPIWLLIALAIRMSSRGPVIFRQIRVGRHGESFEMFKFRTMIDGAHAGRAALDLLNESSGIFKLKNDPRLTVVGRLLRSTSLDELPQLINVLRGEMSLVGPRPLILEEDRLIEGIYRERLQLRPGMTGPWQAIGPVRPPLRGMVVIDCLYAENWSLAAVLRAAPPSPMLNRPRARR